MQTPLNFFTTKYSISFIDDKGIMHTGFMLIKPKNSQNTSLFFQNKWTAICLVSELAIGTGEMVSLGS